MFVWFFVDGLGKWNRKNCDNETLMHPNTRPRGSQREWDTWERKTRTRGLKQCLFRKEVCSVKNAICGPVAIKSSDIFELN